MPHKTTEPLRSIISASNMARRKACPGSARAEKGLERVEGPYSEEGSLLHHHDAHPAVGRSTLTLQHREILERNARLRDEFLDRELPRLGIASDAKCIIKVESELLLCDENDEPLRSHGQYVPGHPDRIHWYPDYKIAIIFDSKFGRIAVEPAEINAQLRFYFCAFCDWFSPETVIVAITQPWAARPNDFHSAEYSAKDAPAFKQELLDIIRATEPENAPRHASIAACTYCLACIHSQCPIGLSAVVEVAVQKVAALQPDQLEAMWPQILMAEKTIEYWYATMRSIKETTPDLLPNTELKSTGSTRLADAVLVYERFKNEIFANLDRDDRIGKFLSLFCKFSVSDFENWMRESKSLTGPQAKQAVRDVLGELLTEKPKAKSLVRKA